MGRQLYLLLNYDLTAAVADFCQLAWSAFKLAVLLAGSVPLPLKHSVTFTWQKVWQVRYYLLNAIHWLRDWRFCPKTRNSFKLETFLVIIIVFCCLSLQRTVSTTTSLSPCTQQVEHCFLHPEHRTGAGRGKADSVFTCWCLVLKWKFQKIYR